MLFFMNPIRKHRCALVLFAFLSCAGAPGFAAGAPGGGIRLSEVLYDSRGRGQLEYLELHNSGSEPVDLLGWSFVDGIRHSFDRSAVIAPQGFLVVARRSSEVEGFFALPPGSTAGDFEGGLDADGERIELADAEGRTVEELTYRDGFPFRGLEPGIEIGPGTVFSLQRLCFEVPAGAPFNWRPAAPTPGAAAETLGCPPAPPAPRPTSTR